MSAHRGPRRLDTRAWLLWGAAASVPLLIGRHPFVIAQLLVIVLVVRAVCLPSKHIQGWSWLLRVGMAAVPLGVLFNTLTVHAGNAVLFRLPEELPLFGGRLTWNAMAYGLLSGVTIVVLIAIGTTVAAGLDWSALMRLIPARASGIAVAGSVAWAFLPQLTTSWREIREAQAARGHRWRGVRDVVPLVVPLLAGGLDRSITMAEALEARGFGAAAVSPRVGRLPAVAAGASLTAVVLALYLFVVGQSLLAAGAALGALVSAAVGLGVGGGEERVKPTRYRRVVWTQEDTVVAAGALLAVLATAVALQVEPSTLRYDPYPVMRWPSTELWLLLALSALMVPAAVAPAYRGAGEVQR